MAGEATKLQIFRCESPVHVLGPGPRAVIWVQGCPFGCPGCIVPESWDDSGGRAVEVDELAHWVVEQPDVTGLTLSGGEPLRQAAALSSLIDSIRQHSDFGVVCYTGYTLEAIRREGCADKARLLERIDLLIDGVYRRDLHAGLLWRGSSNQRLLPLTARYRAEVDSALSGGHDESAGVEFTFDANGAVGFVGVPAMAGFREEFVGRMRARGVRLGFAAEHGSAG